MVVETLYVTINREELRELREESAELARLRAQPDRQVGGDEPDRFCEVEGVAWGIFSDGAKDYRSCTKQRIEELRELWQARAALAPAAVVCLMPDKAIIAQSVDLDCSLIPGSTPYNAAEYAYDRIADSLNRRAIPADLLNRAAEALEEAADTIEREYGMNEAHKERAVLNELRALLGKEEK